MLANYSELAVTLRFVFQPTCPVCLQRTCSFKRRRNLERNDAVYYTLSHSFQNFQQFRSVRLAKSFPLLDSWFYLGLVALLHCGLVKVSLFLSLNLSVLWGNAKSLSLSIYFKFYANLPSENLTGKECCLTKLKKNWTQKWKLCKEHEISKYSGLYLEP